MLNNVLFLSRMVKYVLLKSLDNIGTSFRKAFFSHLHFKTSLKRTRHHDKEARITEWIQYEVYCVVLLGKRGMLQDTTP